MDHIFSSVIVTELLYERPSVNLDIADQDSLTLSLIHKHASSLQIKAKCKEMHCRYEQRVAHLRVMVPYLCYKNIAVLAGDVDTYKFVKKYLMSIL